MHVETTNTVFAITLSGWELCCFSVVSLIFINNDFRLTKHTASVTVVYFKVLSLLRFFYPNKYDGVMVVSSVTSSVFVYSAKSRWTWNKM